VGLLTLRNVPVQDTNLEFTQLADKYLNTLFDICRQEVQEEIGHRVLTRDLLAVYAAGGLARAQAYDDDFDIIVLLDSDDPEVVEYASRVISRMNADILKRGTLPHYKLVERFGTYVVQLDDLAGLLSSDSQDVFIEKSQVLGLRLVMGSPKFERKLGTRAIEPHIFDRFEDYVRQVVQEIRSRHEDATVPSEDIKESPGGLRDIELVSLLYKAKLRIREPIGGEIFERFAQADPGHSREIRKLWRGFNALRGLRDVYRLTVAATDLVEREHLDRPAAVMGYESGEELHEMYSEVRKETLEAVEKITGEILG
jgi:UTP:GlnB (protein PII) uridylyltransferase